MSSNPFDNFFDDADTDHRLTHHTQPARSSKRKRNQITRKLIKIVELRFERAKFVHLLKMLLKYKTYYTNKHPDIN